MTKLAHQLERSAAGFLDGLGMIYNTVSTVNIVAGTCKDSTGTEDIRLDGTTAADITASGAGGLDTGSEASSTWYAVYVIKGDGVAPDTLISTSFSSPTLPANYTHFRRVGAIRNDGSSDLINFYQRGSGRTRRVWWHDPSGDIGLALSAGTATTATSVNLAGGMPSSSESGVLRLTFITDSAGDTANLYYDSFSGVHVFFKPGVVDAAGIRANQEMITTPSQTIHYAVDTGSSLSIGVVAYDDEL